MTIHQVNVYEAKTHLSKLIEHALGGDEVIIARSGSPAVRLVRWEPEAPRVPGIWRSKVRIAADFEDFSAADEADWYGAVS